MKIQIFFIILFVLNMAAIWSTVFLKKCEWYRTVGIMIYAVIPLLTVFSDQPSFELDFYWWKIAGMVAIVLGAGIVGWGRLEFMRGGSLLADVPEQFIASGPYQFVRHPQYLGLVFIWVGWWWVWAAIYAFYFGMIFLALNWVEAYLEEKLLLEKRFGDEYRAYRRHTGMFWIK